MLIRFSQQDPRWANKKFGNYYTIGRWGCTITALVMAYDWFYGDNKTPDWMADQLKYLDGMVIWSSMPKMKLVARIRYRDDNAIREALANPNECCLVEVNHSHWLFVIGRYIPWLGYRVVDPWNGQIVYTNKYQNNITGVVVVSR